MFKILNLAIEALKIWARKRLMPWFRASTTAWLYENAKKRIRMYSSNQLDTGPVAFKRAFETHRNAVTTTVKRTLKTIDCDGREGEEKQKEDLERSRTLCTHVNFCRNREMSVYCLRCCKQRVEEQRCWATTSNRIRMATDVLQDTENESAESILLEEEMEHEQQPTDKMHKMRLEEFRSFRFFKRRKLSERDERKSNKKEDNKIENCFVRGKLK